VALLDGRRGAAERVAASDFEGTGRLGFDDATRAPAEADRARMRTLSIFGRTDATQGIHFVATLVRRRERIARRLRFGRIVGGFRGAPGAGRRSGRRADVEIFDRTVGRRPVAGHSRIQGGHEGSDQVLVWESLRPLGRRLVGEHPGQFPSNGRRAGNENLIEKHFYAFVYSKYSFEKKILLSVKFRNSLEFCGIFVEFRNFSKFFWNFLEFRIFFGIFLEFFVKFFGMLKERLRFFTRFIANFHFFSHQNFTFIFNFLIFFLFIRIF